MVVVGKSAGSTAGGLTTVVFATKCAFGVMVLIGMVRMTSGREVVCTESVGYSWWMSIRKQMGARGKACRAV